MAVIHFSIITGKKIFHLPPLSNHNATYSLADTWMCENKFSIKLLQYTTIWIHLRNLHTRALKPFNHIWEAFYKFSCFHYQFFLIYFVRSIFRFCLFLGIMGMQLGMTWHRQCHWLTWLHLLRAAGTDAGLLWAHGPSHCSYRGGMAGQVQVDVDLLVLPEVAGLSVSCRHRKWCHRQ